MDTERNVLIEALKDEESNSHLQKMFERPIDINSAKISERSEQARNKGNQLYLQKNHDAETHIEIFYYYCQSISLAPLDSELLAKGYGNRSALLLHINKYEECIVDVDRALEITKSDLLTIKLLCRKVECMKKLALPNYQSVLQNVENLASKVDEKNRTEIDKLINKVKACYIGNRKVSKNQLNPCDILSEKDQPFDGVSIAYSEKYGRHLIAKKDYSPGDFIFRDKLYVTVLKRQLNYTNCNYCLKICLSGVACDYCSWAMFCSEECRKKAWDTFHDIECSALSSTSDRMYFGDIRLSLRILLTGIRETGSIDKLRDQLNLVDRSTDERYKGFYKDGQFTNSTIQSIYSLKGREISKFCLEVLVLDVLITLISIVKHGKLIDNVKLKKANDVIANEDLVFLGSLLIRFTLINSDNGFLYSQMNCDCQRLKKANYKCCNRGNGLAALASLLNHSCNANALRIFTEDRYINIFAVLPIKKDSQIFITYAAFYYDKIPKDRKMILKAYDIKCDCEACIESWPPLFCLPNYFDLITMQSVFEKRLYNNCKYIFDALDVKKLDFSKKDVKKLCKTIAEANKQLKQPTIVMATLEDSLMLVYARIYSWKSPIHVFGTCNKNASDK